MGTNTTPEHWSRLTQTDNDLPEDQNLANIHYDAMVVMLQSKKIPSQVISLPAEVLKAGKVAKAVELHRPVETANKAFEALPDVEMADSADTQKVKIEEDLRRLAPTVMTDDLMDEDSAPIYGVTQIGQLPPYVSHDHLARQ